MARQRRKPVPIILYERDCNWREVVSAFSNLPPHPCVILMSATADKNLWDELARCGGSDILRTPFEPETLRRIVKSGWALWTNQQRLRPAAARR